MNLYLLCMFIYIKNIVSIIILNKLVSVGLIKNKKIKNKSLYFTASIPYSFLSALLFFM